MGKGSCSPRSRGWGRTEGVWHMCKKDGTRQGVAGAEKMPFELEVLRDQSREGLMERDLEQVPAVSEDSLMTQGTAYT